MDWIQLFQITGTISASVASSAGLTWKLVQYYIQKESKEPIQRLEKEIELMKTEVDLMKMEMRTYIQTANETKTALVEVSTKLNYIVDEVRQLSREVLDLIKKD